MSVGKSTYFDSGFPHLGSFNFALGEGAAAVGAVMRKLSELHFYGAGKII